jgi:hypothetical protein
VVLVFVEDETLLDQIAQRDQDLSAECYNPETS